MAPQKGDLRFRLTAGGLFLAALLLVGVLCAQPAVGSTTVGSMPGQFSVSPTGAATYQIPLDLPPGVNGLKPNLALLYNSQAGNGLLGEGWSLTGLSVITRCPQTLDDQTPAIHIPDGTSGASGDRFCLDGQRLILTSGTYGAAGSVYHTEIESFQQVTASGSAGGSPTSFAVVDRSGLTRQYSTVPFNCPNGAALEWLITKITDHYGNFISFQYDVGFYDLMPNGTAAQAYGIQEIDYGNSQGTVVGRALFTYDNGQTGSDRPDSHSIYVGATGVAVDVNAVILTGITVKDGNGAVLRTYNLSYNNTGFSPDLPPVTLASVQECGSDGTCFNPTSFTDSGATSDFSGGNQFGNDSAVQGPNFQVLDLDGDGLPDYVYAANSTVYVIFGNNLSTAVATSVPWATSTNDGIGLQTAVVTDLNGDGQQELLVPYYSHPGVTPNTPTWYLLKWNGQAGSNANLTAEPVPTTSGGTIYACASDDGCMPDAVVVDTNGKGEPGILFADGGELYYYANTNGELSGSPVATGITYSGSMPKLMPVNYDGQGTPEVYVAGTGVVKWNRSSGVFQLIVSGNFGESNGNIVQFINSSGLSSAVVMTGSYWWYCPNTGSGFLFLSQEAGNPNACAESAGTLSGEDLSQAQPVDFYGDGRQEILVPANSAWWLFNGVTFTQLSTVQVPYAGSNTEFIDINGDGRADMLFTSNGHTQYYFNNASPYLLNQITNGLGHNTDVGYVPLTDAGHSAFVMSYPSPVVTTANRPEIRSYVGPMYVVDDYAVDTGLSNSGGAEQIYTYYKYGGPALDQWGRGFLGFARVEAINFNTGLYTDVTYRQDFPFTGMVATSNRYYVSQPLQSASPGVGGVKIVCTHLTNGEPDCEPTSSGSQPVASFTTGNTLQATTNTSLTDAAPYSGVHYPYVGQSTTQLFDLGTWVKYETTTTNSTYQPFAGTPIGTDIMPTDINVSTTASAGSTSTTAIVDTQTGYGQESTCPGHATSVTVTDTYNGTQAPAKTENLQYDGNCFLTQDTKTIVGLPSGGSMTLTKQYTPDGYGNPVSSTVAGTNVAVRTTGMSYDPTERFPVSITNALGQTESLSYNDWGEKLSDTDANGDTVTYQYDGFGRKIQQNGPEPAVEATWAYTACAVDCAPQTPVAYIVAQENWHVNPDTGTKTVINEAVNQYDELGRVLRTLHTGFSAEWVIQDTQYDLLGRVSQTSIPCRVGDQICGSSSAPAPTCWNTNTYDVLNRVITETQPYNATTTSCGSTRTITPTYNGLSTSKAISATGTSITSETIATTLNALGKPATVTDTGGTTAYGYDPWGDVTSVTPPDGNTVSMTYDSAGDKWSMHDPDMGAWSYTYDALGELLTQTDAKNQTVSNTYDALGRLVNRTEPEGTSLWKYDIAYGAGVGRLAYKQGPNGVWEGYAYDAYGHPTDKITVLSGQEYWVTTTYDDQGRVSQVVYPNLTGINVNNTPATPTGLQATADANNNAQFDVSWTAQQNGEIYHLYRTAAGASSPTSTDEIYSGPNANWPDDGITVNGSYEWWLKACNDTNCSGYATTTLTVTLPPTVPGTPSVPASDTHAQSIALSWAGSSLVSTTAGPITYEVLESYTSLTATQPGPFTQVTTSSSTAATVSLSQDGTYVFAVKACASGACSAASDASTSYQTYLQPSTPTSISAPSTVEPTSSPATYTVSWPASGFAGGSVTYVLQEETGTGGFTLVYTGGNLSYLESKTQDGKFSYRVEACDANSTSVCSGFTSTATVAVTLPPTNPGTPMPPSSDQHAVSWPVTWSASTLNTGSSGSITYQLYQSFNGGSYSLVSGTPTESGSTWTLWITAVLSGGYYQNGSYAYELRACTTDPNTGGTACTAYLTSSNYSSTIAPGAPSSLSVPSQSNPDSSFTVSYGAPAANSGGQPSSYYVQLGDASCEPGSGCTYLWRDGSCSSSGLSCTFPANQISPGSYIVRVEASDGGVAGVWAPAAPPYPGITVWREPAPSAPSLSGPSQTTDGTIPLSWSAPAYATSYQLYWSYARATGPWSSWIEIYNGGNTSYTTTVGALDKYNLFYVIACDAEGCSGASNEVETVYNLQGGCKTCTPTKGATAVPTQGTSAPPSPAPSAGTGGFADSAPPNLMPLPYLKPEATPAVVMRTTPLMPLALYRAVKPRSVPAAIAFSRSAVRVAEIISPRQAFFLAHAGQVANSTRPPVRSASSGRIADLHRDSSQSVALGGSGGLHRDSRRFRANSELVTQARSAPSFEKGELVAQALSAPSFEKGGLGRARRTASSGHTGMYTLDFRTEQGSAVRKAVYGGITPANLLVRATWHYAPAINPQLSEYPPLRHDPRVLAHFASLGGVLPGRIERADCGGTDSDSDCSEPTGGTALMVGYVYNNYGYLAQVQKLNSAGHPVQVLWWADDETALGQVDHECFDTPVPSPTQTTCTGQTLTVSDAYDTASGLLDSTTATASAGTVSAGYTWDGYNNVLTRNLGETVSSGTAPPTLNESFTYDALNRLLTVNTSAGTYSNAKSMLYNAVGGFQYKGNYTNYQYSNPGYTVNGYTYSQPHAVSSLTTPTGVTRYFTYDANGNLLTESGDVNRQVLWTSYNKPNQITGNGAQETFVYGPDRSRLQTTITKGTDAVTTTYIDGLFEQVYDSVTGDLTYRHYILAGGARVGVETIAANSGGTITSDTLSFYVHDEVGSVIATVTENLGGANQTVALTSYDAWGKARATTGSTAYQDLPPGTFYSPTPSGQEEGFAGHDNLSDTGLVDMEGRVYDPEVGTFLSADPNVQYPFSSQGYDRYIYVNDNPLSLSDPSGYFSLSGMLSTGDPLAGFFPQQYGQVLSVVGPIVGAALNAVPGCQVWCDALVTSVTEAQAGYLETGSIGAGLRAGVLAGAESLAFTYVAVPYGANPVGGALLERSIADGLVGGAFSAAGGGRFGDGFLGAFVGSESSAAIGTVGGDPNSAPHYAAANIATRAVLSAVVGGAASRLNGGDFTEGAVAAALQSVVNDEYAKQIVTARHLTADEIAGAKRVFGDKIDYSDVRVINGKFLFWQSSNDAMTPNGNIYWPGACDDLVTCDSTSRYTFIHEMTHVMQYQAGVNVEWQGMWLQIGSYFGSNPYIIPASYQPGIPFSSYNIEQQGQISIQIYLGKWPNIVNPGGGL